MELDDIIYLSLLFGSIIFGYYYKQIKDKEQKKIVGSAIGLVIIFIVSGLHIFHSFITFFVNAIIILFVDKRKCHLVSFIFSFLYLFFFRTTIYFGIPYPPNHTNLVQMMMTLKMVGLAFDVNSSYNMKKKGDQTDEQILEDKSNDLNLNMMDIFYYTFTYIGVLTGPYMRYRTFKDYFELPYSKYVDWKDATINKLKFVPIYAILFLLVSTIWPLSYAKTDEFYNETSFLYRLWYIWPNFFTFRMRLYVGLVLSECVCTVAGFGAYPILSEPKEGLGPSKNFKELQKINKNEAELAKLEYNFETIHNVRPYDVEFCPTFRESMKHWNICIQYWLAINIYKRFPNKKYRTFATMFVSAIWHGVYTGYYVCILGVPLVLPIEDIYVKLILKDRKGFALKCCNFFMIFFKMFFFSYLSIAFHLLSLDWIIHYYNSVYHFGLIYTIIVYFLGVKLLKLKNKKEKSGIEKCVDQELKKRQ